MVRICEASHAGHLQRMLVTPVRCGSGFYPRSTVLELRRAHEKREREGWKERESDLLAMGQIRFELKTDITFW